VLQISTLAVASLCFARAACGFGQRAPSGFSSTSQWSARGAVLDWRAGIAAAFPENVIGRCFAFTGARTSCFLLCGCAESDSSPKYKDFCNSAAAVWNSKCWPLTPRAWGIPGCVDHTDQRRCLPGDSITAMTPLFLVARADHCFEGRTAAPPARFGASRGCGKGNAGWCGARASIGGSNGTYRKNSYKTNTCVERSITVACYLCNTHPKTA
jgi:hypothetical protein